MELLFATNNRHKLREILEIAGDRHVIFSLADAGLVAEIPENADTLEGNAIEKARFVYERTGRNCFADDTGLEIDALNGRPGVYSARYAGEGCTFDDNVRKVLIEMEGVELRTARFRCVICLILNGEEYLFEGRVEGSILERPDGDGGFGYDPVFRPQGFSQSFASMSPGEKNQISHRGRAMRAMMNFLG